MNVNWGNQFKRNHFFYKKVVLFGWFIYFEIEGNI